MTAEMPPGSVVITPAQMYAEIRTMAEKVDHLAAVVDPALSTIRDDVSEIRDDLGDHETRIRSIERRVWVFAGTAMAGGAGIAQAASLLNR
jgi:hypothetical protein